MSNKPLTPGTISSIVQMLNMRVSPEVSKIIQEKNGLESAKQFNDEFGKGISALHKAISALNDGKQFNLHSRPPYPEQHYANQDGWLQLILNELFTFNAEGSAYITSVTECIIKTLGLINTHHQAFHRDLAYYRGHVDASWEIVSSIGRKISPDDIPDDRNQVSRFELNALRSWQDKVFSSDGLQQDIFSEQPTYNSEDPRWWALKQHYDSDPHTGGTRLIDWTSSPLAGLYFACIDWDGSINDSIDGGLYVAMTGAGRRFASEQYLEGIDRNNVDFYDKAGNTVENYFTLDRFTSYPRTVITEHESTRQLSQDGHFIFTSEFEKPISEWGGAKPFFFVIPGSYKENIARELFSLGYTPRKIVRGRAGEGAHNNLMAQLNIN